MKSPKLITITPNPALDLSGAIEKIVPNEKLHVTHERRDPGGNGINAARIAHRLGTPVLATGFIGGAVGDEIRKMLNHEKIETAFVSIQGITRINVTVSEKLTHKQTRLTFPGPQVSRKETSQLIKQIQNHRGPGIIVLGGSLPQDCPKDFYEKLAKAAIGGGLGVIADLPSQNLRRIVAKISGSLLLIKPNQSELEEWAGHPLKSDLDLARATRRLTHRVCLVCVSLAERGALLAFDDQVWFAPAVKIWAKGTVGAGDSMVGAMAAKLVEAGLTSPDLIRRAFQDDRKILPKLLENAFRWGMAAGAATAEVSGTQLAKTSEIKRLFQAGIRKKVVLFPSHGKKTIRKT